MTRRFYANAAPQQTLAAPITSGATTCTIAGSFSGYPVSFPFFAALDKGTASFEVVSVTAIAGTTATIVRAQDGTSAVSHPAGATLDFVVIAKDFDEANAHVNASTGVHGVSGSVVGTSDAQTLTNKTLSSPTISGTVPGNLNVAANVAAGSQVSGATGSFSGAVSAGSVSTGGAVAATGAVTGGSLSANGNGAVTGVHVPKTYTTEAAASTALPSPVTGSSVYLTAPTTGPAGIYIWNGSAWIHGSGYDTGWLNFASLVTGWTNDSVPAQARQIGQVVYLVGGVVNASFASGTFTTVGVLPAGVAPPTVTHVYKIPRSSGSLVSEARLLVDMELQVFTSAAASNAFRFDGLTYLVT